MTMVTCVPTEDFLNIMHPQTGNGYWLIPTVPWPDAEKITQLLFSLAATYERTTELENNQELLQVIPYIAIQTADDKFLYYYRKGQEGRLHGSSSIGFGGHALLDLTSEKDFDDSILREMKREIEEEVSKEIADEVIQNANLVAVLYNQENEVSRVHLGLAYASKLNKTADQLKELASIECGKIHTGTAKDIAATEMELWTASLLDAILYREQIDIVIKSTGQTFTGLRRPNTDDAFLCPERDMAAQAFSILDDVMMAHDHRMWLQLWDALRLAELDPECMGDAVRCVSKLLSLAEQPEDSETATYLGALKASGFFSLPHELRGYFCAMLGLSILSHMWLSVRQYSYASHDVAEQYAKMNDKAGDALRRLLGKEDEKTFVANNILRYVREGKISKAELMRLVEEA
jgi:predicted NUDIX family phosphoesterase